VGENQAEKEETATSIELMSNKRLAGAKTRPGKRNYKKKAKGSQERDWRDHKKEKIPRESTI